MEEGGMRHPEGEGEPRLTQLAPFQYLALAKRHRCLMKSAARRGEHSSRALSPTQQMAASHFVEAC